MAATFCLRLAFGLVAMLPFLPASVVPPRFFRVHFLTALGLLAIAAFFVRDFADAWWWGTFGFASILAIAGSIVWHLDEAPWGKAIVFLAPLAFGAAMVQAAWLAPSDCPWATRLGDDFAGAFMPGSATTAMLMGHSYLIAPAMTLSPLFRLLSALAGSLVLRTTLAAIGLWLWTSHTSGTMETETMLWLAARWGLGVVAPLVLGWLAWETARIRSTQSATGILYVVVIVCFLGELTSQLLAQKTGYIL